MKKSQELRLDRSALMRRIRYHRMLSNGLIYTFWGGSILLAFSTIGVLVHKSRRSTWAKVGLGGMSATGLSALFGPHHMRRANELVLEAVNRGSIDPETAQAALGLLERDAALDDDIFTPPAALGPLKAPLGPGLTEEGWDDLRESW